MHVGTLIGSLVFLLTFAHDVFGQCEIAYPLLTVSGLVWNDSNDNGIRDDWEHGLAGIGVELYTADPSTRQLILSSTTDGSGQYSFVDFNTICSDTEFVVHFDRPSGWAFSPPLQTERFRNSDVVTSDGFSVVFDWVINSFPITHVDCGLVPPPRSTPKCSCTDCFDQTDIQEGWVSRHYQQALSESRLTCCPS